MRGKCCTPWRVAVGSNCQLFFACQRTHEIGLRLRIKHSDGFFAFAISKQSRRLFVDYTEEGVPDARAALERRKTGNERALVKNTVDRDAAFLLFDHSDDGRSAGVFVDEEEFRAIGDGHAVGTHVADAVRIRNQNSFARDG